MDACEKNQKEKSKRNLTCNDYCDSLKMYLMFMGNGFCRRKQVRHGQIV